ncbi:MAG: DUF1080 domain-containing protein [Planctomycetota bacterium]
MQTLFAFVALAFFTSLASCAANGDGAEDPPGAGEWRALFDGTDPSQHWRGFRKDEFPAGWVAEDGCLVMRGGGGDIVSREEFDDFELSLEWRVTEAGNSGVFFRVDEEHDYVWQTGPEMQVLDDERHVDGKEPKTSAGSNYALHAPSVAAVRPAGEWNVARLVVEGDRVEHWLNGERIVDYRLWSDEWEALVQASKFAGMPDYGRNLRGHIALQDHGDLVWFRNLKVRRL